jgi:type II secretory pathway component GspD/PulD (secretin)
MSRTLLVAALVLGVGLGAASAQEKPAEGRAPMVSVQMVMAELILEPAAKRERPSPQSSGSAKGGATISALDLSAPDEKLREELRKLGIQGRFDVLYRINLAAADGQKTSLQLSGRQPQISGITMTQFGQTNNINMLNTGTTIEVQPRVAGEVVSLTVSLEDSRLGPAEEGVPIAVPAKGETTRAAPIHNFSLRTAVNVPSGRTIVLSGLISEDGPRKRQRLILLCPRIIPLNASEPVRPSR